MLIDGSADIIGVVPVLKSVISHHYQVRERLIRVTLYHIDGEDILLPVRFETRHGEGRILQIEALSYLRVLPRCGLDLLGGCFLLPAVVGIVGRQLLLAAEEAAKSVPRQVDGHDDDDHGDHRAYYPLFRHMLPDVGLGAAGLLLVADLLLVALLALVALLLLPGVVDSALRVHPFLPGRAVIGAALGAEALLAIVVCFAAGLAADGCHTHSSLPVSLPSLYRTRRELSINFRLRRQKTTETSGCAAKSPVCLPAYGRSLIPQGRT